MAHHEGFLRDIVEHPEDDAPRLIYADWLDENGDSTRAEFVRVQCELARPGMKPCTCFPSRWPGQTYVCQRCILRGRERELLSAEQDRVREEWRRLAGPGADVWWDAWAFCRGFVAEVTLPCGGWLRHGRALVRAAPLERVVLADVPVYPVDGEWRRAYLNRERVPAEIWALLEAKRFGANWTRFPSHAAALDALSAACLKWARKPVAATH